MKSGFTKICIACFIFLACTGIKANNGGLYFHSHNKTTDKRTTLTLNGNQPFKIGEMLEMTFNMDLRQKPFFGNIFCIKTNNGKHIDAIFAISDNDNYRPALVADGQMHHINHYVSTGTNIPAGIKIDRKSNRITLMYANREMTVDTDLSGATSATIFFGMHPVESNYPDVAPINVRDIKISQDGRTNYFWNLRQHDGNVAYDSISSAKATARNGHWILDDHIKWKTIFKTRTKKKAQITFAPDKNLFYIADGGNVTSYNPVTNTTKNIKVNGGHRAMAYSNYFAYNAAKQDLYTYNLQKKQLSHFDLSTGKWSCGEHLTDEPVFASHAWATEGDSVGYAFGGYGFYRYNNRLFRITPGQNRIEEIDYSPKLSPRTGAAAAVVDNKLYIFGGYGNEQGKQELPGKYYYELWCIDLETKSATKVWSTDGEQSTSFQMASEMIYNKEDSSFYAATTHQSGRLLKIWMKKPGFKAVTDAIEGKFNFKDLTYNLYKSEKYNKIYVVINKRYNDLSHEITIFSIDTPIQDDYETEPDTKPQESGNTWMWWLAVLLAAGVAATALYVRHSRRTTTAKGSEAKQEVPENPGLHNLSDMSDQSDSSEMSDKSDQSGISGIPEKTYYDITGGSIRILGKFAVTDRNGDDITAQFTKRARNLLIMLLLHSATDNKGIEIHVLDEVLWQDMNEEAARNNRNVYMRKLRILLEKVGNIEITNDKIHYRINIGDEVFFDYKEAMKMMQQMADGNGDEEAIARTLELLFAGALLPNYSYEWLDKFKADFSDMVLSQLTRQMNRCMNSGNEQTAMKIAQTIMQHDPFSDEALSTQCSILCKNNKRGIAKSIYDNFCKIYEQSIGEKYERNFAEVCR